MLKEFELKEWQYEKGTADCGVYQIVNTLNEDCYIGASVALGHRKSQHFRELKSGINGCRLLQEAYNIYGRENLVFKVLEFCERKDLLEREQYYTDIMLPKYNIRTIVTSNKGIKLLPLSKEKRINRIEAAIKSRGKAVVVLTKEGEFIEEMSSIAEVSRKYKLSIGNIFSVLQTQNKRSASSLTFVYKHLYDPTIDYKIYSQCGVYLQRPIEMLDLEGNFIREFNNVKEAREYFGKISAAISNCLTKRSTRAYGYKWRYKGSE